MQNIKCINIYILVLLNSLHFVCDDDNFRQRGGTKMNEICCAKCEINVCCFAHSTTANCLKRFNREREKIYFIICNLTMLVVLCKSVIDVQTYLTRGNLN